MRDRCNLPEHRLLVVAALLLLTSMWPGAPALGQPPGEATVLRTGRVLDGRGEVLVDRDLVVRDGRNRRDRCARNGPGRPRLRPHRPDGACRAISTPTCISATTLTTTARCTGTTTTPAPPT